MNNEIVAFYSNGAILAAFPWKPVVSVWFGLALATGLSSLGMKQEKVGFSACGGAVFLMTIIQLICWLTIGPYSLKWLVGPFIAVGFLFLLTGNEEGGAQGGVSLIIYALIFWGIASAVKTEQKEMYEEWQNTIARDYETVWKKEFEELWPTNLQQAPEGYLLTKDHIPVRALARCANVQLFDKKRTKAPDDVTEIMRPWTPYYVFERSDTALLIGETENTEPKDRTWVRGWECFCWTTRECLNIERPVPVYASIDDAKARRSPRDTAYKYDFNGHFVGSDGDDRKTRFVIASLPVLHRIDSKYWCVVRPEGSDGDSALKGGYGACWLEWDGFDSSIVCRIRTTRRELETFLGNLQTLLLDYETNPEKRDGAKWEMYNRGVQKFTWREFQRLNRTEIRKGLEGIPLRPGFMGQQIESDLQAKKIKDRIVFLARRSNDELWTADEVTFVEADQIP